MNSEWNNFFLKIFFTFISTTIVLKIVNTTNVIPHHERRRGSRVIKCSKENIISISNKQSTAERAKLLRRLSSPVIQHPSSLLSLTLKFKSVIGN